MGRILAIDYGTKRTGIAVSDPLRLIAGGLDTVDTKGLEAWLAKYFASEDVSTIVVGKPSRMDGTPSETWRFFDYPEVKKLVEDMFLTLGEAEGVGLAAPQIGKNIRLFIVDCTPWGEDDPECADYKRAFINPEIYALSEEKKTYNEGCLSFPGIHADVPRSLAIRMRYMDEDFVEHDEEFHGLKAWVIQHEYDHIEGIVFTDRISPLRRNLLKGKLMNLAKGKYRCAYKTK